MHQGSRIACLAKNAGQLLPYQTAVRRNKQDVWQQEPQSEGLTVLALRQMVAYADTVVQFSENSPLWEAKNEYSLYKGFLLDIISWRLKNYRTSKQFLWQMCFYLNPEYTYYYMYGKEITDDNAVEWKKTLFQEAAQLYPDSLLFKCIDPIECMDHRRLDRFTEEEKAQIRAELAEWNLQENELDHEVVWIFDHYLFHEGIQR